MTTPQAQALADALQRIVDWDAAGMALTEDHIAQAKAALATQAEAPAAPAQADAWTVFNGAGTVIATEVDEATMRLNMTEHHIARGWSAVRFRVVKSSADLAVLAATPAQLAAPVKIHTEALRLSDELLMPYASDFHKVCEEASLTLRWLSLELAKEVSAREAAQGHPEALRAKQPAPVVQPLTVALQRTLDAYISSNYTSRIEQTDPVIVEARAALAVAVQQQESGKC